MFSVPHPQVVSKEDLPSDEKLKQLAIKQLNGTGQRPGHAVGFFEQGVFIGLGITAFIVLPTVSWGIWTAGRQAWRVATSRGR